MRSRHRRFIGGIALAMVSMTLALVLWPVARASAEGDGSLAVYVSAKGDDESGDGSKESPYASLAKGVERAGDGATVYVMSDLEMTKCARFYDKSLTITSGAGGPYTLFRSDSFEFEGQSDTARSWYNPALIEVGNTSEGAVATQLTLTDIVLDDNFTHEGEYFIQAASEGGGTHFGSMHLDNLDIVQDAMVATYAPSVTINLGNGAVLKDFGGMSAVRLTGGSHLNMYAGSKIYDSETFNRSKGTEITGAEKGLYGPAGAIWSQGGNVTIENEASIENVNGRAIYMDSGEVTVDGTISGIKSNKNAMWQGETGFVIHLRNGARAKIGPHGVIDGADVESSGSAIDVPEGCQLTTAGKSTIKNLNKGTAISTNGVVTLAGEITGCQGWAHAIVAQSGSFQITLAPTAHIHDNYCSYGAIYAQSTGGVIDIYGRINNNISNDRGGGIAMANNMAGTKVTMYNGAEICDNVSYQTGGGVMVSCGTFTMKGGTIANNISGVGTDESAKAGGGVFVRRGGQFIMNGGTIADNMAAGIGGNIAFEMGDYNGMTPCVQLNRGTVAGGTMKAYIAAEDGSYSSTGGEANDIAVAADTSDNHTMFGKVSRYLSVSDEISLSEQSIFMDDYDFYLENLGDDVKLGNASKAAEDAVTKAYENEGLTAVKGSFWYATDGAAREFNITGLDYDHSKPLYAAVMKTNASGAAVDGSNTLRSVKVKDAGTLSLSLPGRSADGYAVVLLQQKPDAKIVSIIPADVTVYEGGEGYTAVVGDNGGDATENSMPHPLFRIEGVDNASGLVFSSGTGGKTWTAVSDENGYYHFKSGSGQDDVRVTYTDAAGNKVISDKFEVSAVEDTFKQFSIDLFLGENDLDSIKIQGNTDYKIVLGTGTLTVRAIQAANPDAVVSKVIGQGSLESQESGEAVAVADDSTTYTLNDTKVELPDDAIPSLLFDDIIDDANNYRTGALASAIEKSFTDNVDEGYYQAKYLDLVDAKNSNAWITASEPVTVYWGYPKGTDTSTNFTLYHFGDLHRDGANSGYDVEDINAAKIETVNVTDTDKGIKFDVKSGGFSPFVLVWDRPSGGTVIPPAATHTITATAGSGGSISPSGEVAVTEGTDQAFAITPDEGNKVRDVAIDGKSVGALGSYTFEDVRGDHTISVTFTRGNAPADPDDTGVSDWFETGDHDAFMHGYDDGTGRFGPDDNMTRGEAAQMFYNMLKDKSRGDVQFDFEDLSEGAWYYEAVATMASHGILLGTSPTTVEPERPITRAEFTAMAMRFSKGDLSGENIFTDVFEGDWYYGVIVGSIKYGWISGYDDGTGRFGPNDNITRAQATIIANRMLGRVPDGVYINAHLDELTRFPDVSEGFYAFRDIVEATNSHDYSKDGGFEHWSALR